MKKTSLILLITFLIFKITSAQYLYDEGYIQTVSDDQATKSFTFKNLQIYPLIAEKQFIEAHCDIGKYTTLKEALEKKKIEISETETIVNRDNINDNQINQQLDDTINIAVQNNVIQQNDVQIQQQLNVNTGGSASVNKLYIQNISKDTIYIMAGEVVKGGKQDRVIAQDMIIPPNSKKIDLSVFCVEKGRWKYKDKSKFDGYFSVASNNVRKTVIQKQNQSAVWEEVDKTVKKNKAESNTGAYTNLVNSENYQKDLKEYLQFFNIAINNTDNCIGFVGVSGDKIIGCDIFATSELFKKQSEGILKGYITEAITSDSKPNVKFNEIEKYLNFILTSNADEQNANIKSKGNQFKHNNKKLHITTFD